MEFLAQCIGNCFCWRCICNSYSFVDDANFVDVDFLFSLFKNEKKLKSWAVKTANQSIKTCWQSTRFNPIVHGEYKLMLQHERGRRKIYVATPKLSSKQQMLYTSNFEQIFNNCSSKVSIFLTKLVIIFKIMLQELYKCFFTSFSRLIFIKN